MDLINNRYRVIKELVADDDIISYLVQDIWNENKEMQLHIFNENIRSQFIEYFSKEFIQFTNLKSAGLLKDYHFSRLTYINNRSVSESMYFYTSEYIETLIPIAEVIDEIRDDQVIVLFVNVCRAINYLHIKGHTYGRLSLADLYFNPVDGGIKLNSVATVRLGNFERYIDKAGENLLKPISTIDDMYDLGCLLLSLIRKKEYIGDPLEALTHTKEQFIKADKQLTILLQIAEDLLYVKESRKFENVRMLVDVLGERLERTFSLIDTSEIERLKKNTKLVNQEAVLNPIIEAYDKSRKYESTKRLFFIKGETGSGKTRLIEELEFLLRLKGANVYSTYDLIDSNASDNTMWIKLLRKLIIDSSFSVYEKYVPDLIDIFPELIDKEKEGIQAPKDLDKIRYYFIERISNFILHTVRNKPTVFLIDNLNYANGITLETIQNLIKLATSNKAILVCTYNDSIGEKQLEFMEFLNKVTERLDASKIDMKKLSIEHTTEMVQDILSIAYAPVKLSQKIYESSDGNPHFVNEVLRDLFLENVIQVNKDTGHWHIDLPETGEYESLAIPTSIEQVLQGQLARINKKTADVLNVLSIFRSPKSVAELVYIFKVPEKQLEDILKELVDIGILYIKSELFHEEYTFKSNLLKKLVYEQTPIKQRVNNHLIVAKLMESANDDRFLDGIIYHYSQANKREKVKQYSMQRALKKRDVYDLKEMIKSIEEALAHTDCSIEKLALLIELGKAFLEYDHLSKAREQFKAAESLAADLPYEKYRIDILVNLADIHIRKGEFEQSTALIEEAEVKCNSFTYIAGSLELNRMKALQFLLQNKIDEAELLCERVIDECGDNYNLTKGDAYRQLAFIRTYGQNQVDKAIELYEKAITLHKQERYTRGIIFSLNNIGVIYSENLGKVDLAYARFKEITDLSVEYGYVTGEIMGLLNIGVYYSDKADYELAYTYYKRALEISLAAKGFKRQMLVLYGNLLHTCIHLRNYKLAHYYYKLSEKEIKIDGYSPTEKLNVFLIHSQYLEVFGLFDEGYRQNLKMVNSSIDETNRSKVSSIIRKQMHHIRIKNLAEYDEEIKIIIEQSERLMQAESTLEVIIDLAIHLHVHNDKQNAQKLMEDIVKKLKLIKNPKEGLLLKYHYLLGLLNYDSEWKKQLLLSMSYANKIKDTELLAKINQEIGDRLFTSKKYYNALNYYLESADWYIYLIEQIPAQYKKSYANLHKLGNLNNKLEQLQAMILEEKRMPDQFDNSSIVESEEELSAIISKLKAIRSANNDFIEKAKVKYIESKTKKQENAETMITNLSGNTLKNIMLVVNNLVDKTLATRGCVAIENEEGKLDLIAPQQFSNMLPNSNIIKQVKIQHKPIMQEVNNASHKNLLENHVNNVRHSLYIPVFESDNEGKQERNIRTRIIAYLCLETDDILHNLTESVIDSNKMLLNLLSLVIERHQLKIAASIDKLTKALTRKYLEDSLVEAMKYNQLNNVNFSIIMYDLDKFKRINDKFGHQSGDEVLRKLSSLVLSNLDEGDQLGRYGGEEFIIILYNKDLPAALQFSENLRKQIEQAKFLNNDTVITISAGVVSSKQGKTINELIHKVDQALYEAKNTGRNKSVSWNNEFTTNIKRFNHLEEVITGDEVQDSRNILAFTELIELATLQMPKEQKINEILGRIIEVTGSHFGYIFTVKDGVFSVKCERGSLQSNQNQKHNYNDHLIKSVIENRVSDSVIDWGAVNGSKSAESSLDWYSNLATPIIYQEEVIGVIYLTVSTKVKEFGVKELSIVNVLSHVCALTLIQ